MKLALEHFGIESLLFTSDSPYSTKDYGTTDGGKKYWVTEHSYLSNIEAIMHLLRIVISIYKHFTKRQLILT